jgi:SAM-dependent methyltransferase
VSRPEVAKAWNSPTTLYLARRLDDLSGGSPLAVLDLGCGDGTVMGQLLDHGHDLSGCDLPERLPALRDNLGKRLGDLFEEKIRVVADERKIPFDNGSFDVVYANQVIEHVRELDNRGNGPASGPVSLGAHLLPDSRPNPRPCGRALRSGRGRNKRAPCRTA